jgi:ADP-heptose:LPS heptosyltransferase
MKKILKQILANLIHAATSAIFWARVSKLGKKRGKQPELSQCQSILVVKLDAIGDLVLTTPFLRALREMAPQARITLVIKSGARELMDVCPFIDEIKVFDAEIPNIIQKSCNLAWAWPRWTAYFYGKRELRGRHFDLALVPRFDVDEVAAAWLVGGARPRYSIAHTESATPIKAVFNSGYDNFYDRPLKSKKRVLHEVERNLELINELSAEPAPCYPTQLWVKDSDKELVDSYYKQWRLSEFDYLVAVVPGARTLKKEWGEANYQQIIAHLTKESKVAVLIFGGPQEKEMAERLSKSSDNVFSTAGVFSLRQSYYALTYCSLYVGSDTGSKHLAAAANVPIVEISCHPLKGNTENHHSPLRFGPWMVPFDVVRPEIPLAPCESHCELEIPHCITQISVMQVENAIQKFWPQAEIRRQALLKANSELAK